MNAVADVAAAAVQASSDSQQWLGPRPRHPGAVLGPRACGRATARPSPRSLTDMARAACREILEDFDCSLLTPSSDV